MAGCVLRWRVCAPPPQPVAVVGVALHAAAVVAGGRWRAGVPSAVAVAVGAGCECRRGVARLGPAFAPAPPAPPGFRSGSARGRSGVVRVWAPPVRFGPGGGCMQTRAGWDAPNPMSGWSIRTPPVCGLCRRRLTLPHPTGCSTISAGRLRYRVRNGSGPTPPAMATDNPFFSLVPPPWGWSVLEKPISRCEHLSDQPCRPAVCCLAPRLLLKG